MVNRSNFHLALGCLAAALATASANAAGAEPTIPQGRNAGTGSIVVLGDSLAVSPSRTQNFPAELQKRLDAAGLHWTVTNAGISGDKTTNGLRRMESVLTRDTRILIVELGVNDGLRGVELSIIETNLSAIIERAQARGIRVLLCGMLVPPRHGWQYAVDFQAPFPRLAARYDVPLVPFLLTGVALNQDLNGPDGIHPNLTGGSALPRRFGLIWSRSSSASRPPSPAGSEQLFDEVRHSTPDRRVRRRQICRRARHFVPRPEIPWPHRQCIQVAAD
jgi:acyl-CoA thioesterase-1